MSRTPKSIVKPWESTLVFFDKNARAGALGPGMVRVKATIDHRWTMNLKKNYQQNDHFPIQQSFLQSLVILS